MAGCLVTSAAAEVRIAASGPGHLRLVYEAERADQQRHAGRSWLVGLPAKGEVKLEVIEVQEGERVRPEGRIDAGDGESLRGPAYLGEIGFIRDQRVAELIFAPREEEDGALRVFDRVVVDLHFAGGGEIEGRGRRDRWGEEFFRRNLLNYDQAKKWRRSRARRSLKAGLQAGGTTLLRAVVREKGMYRITGGDLEEAGIDLREVDSDYLRMFYGGGRPLPQTMGFPPIENEEIAVVVEDGGDGRFDEDDFVLFYGEPVSRWDYDEETGEYRYLHNLYTHDNVYWLGIGGETARKKGVSRSGALRATDAQRPVSHRVRVHQEAEQFILLQTYSIKSGYEWYWEDFRGNARNFPTLIRAAVDEPVDIRMHFLGKSTNEPQFTVKWNDEVVKKISLPGARRVTWELQAAGGAREGLNQLGLFHSADPVRLDWYELAYSRKFAAERGELFFESPLVEGVAEFRLSGFDEEEPRIFDISAELTEVWDFDYDAETGTAAFQDASTDPPRRYAATGPSRWKRPLRLELDRPGRLLETFKGADYLIIVHGDFLEAAQRLADWRGQDDRFGTALRTKVVDVRDIYDEFSGGMLDPTAIRNFIAHAAENWDPAPFFVLLMGDGTYDYKNNSGTSPGNWLPAYQDEDSTYDEWYVRVSGDDVLPDMAIGRLPVQTVSEAERVVDKLIDYDRWPELGPWQSRVLLIADDLSNPEHADNVEGMFLMDAEFMVQRSLPENLDLIKLYLAQFPLEGRTKPRAKAEFIRRFNEGALILTYLGHGNPDVLAHEQMFVVSRDLGKIDNGRRLPLFYTAASQVGVFDDPVRTSMPEALLKLPNGGVIGMISATRVGYHTSNMELANAFHLQMYRTDREHVPVGLALMEAKQMVQVYTTGLSRRNIQRYSLFGDPATRLAAPRQRVDIQMPDSLRALDEVEVKGQVLDAAGKADADFDGQVWVQAFDSAISSQLDGLSYQQIGVALFRGLFPVEEGQFSALFRVPKDITYRGKNGRLSAYAWGDGRPAAFGSVSGLVLAGTAEDVELDQNGPEIDIGFQGLENFSSGGKIPPHATLRAAIRDPSGINVTGETGHEIELVVDGESFKVTEFFSVRGGNYREGILEYPLPALEPGEHEIRLKAWDSFNNSARAELLAEVSEEGDFAVANLLFYPNPLQEGEGHFTYELLVPARSVHIRIFSLSGRLVDEVEGDAQQGYNQVAWQPGSDLANGTYLYRVEVESESGREIARTATVQVMR